MNSFFGNKKTPKQKTKAPEPQYLSEQHYRASIVNRSFKRLVALPKFINLNEWLAATIFDIFNTVNIFWGAVAEFCTAKSCPSMSVGDVEFLWVDAQKKAVKLPAAQYVDYTLTQIQNQVEDESVFPSRHGTPYTKDMVLVCRQICKQLFRVLAHVYCAHFDEMAAAQVEAHLNTLFCHFLEFCFEFDLIDRKEVEPLHDLIAKLAEIGHLDAAINSP